mmetsp:Transcript_150064/g.260762  ORF Transcript_150064/g.260762 Transcript_150064/m.260762 type:complete len:102 (-) Transcript_150064:4-309(-)
MAWFCERVDQMGMWGKCGVLVFCGGLFIWPSHTTLAVVAMILSFLMCSVGVITTNAKAREGNISASDPEAQESQHTEKGCSAKLATPTPEAMEGSHYALLA